MNKCYLQRWEESGRLWGLRPFGCTLHRTLDDCNKFTSEFYVIRQSDSMIPDEYEKVIGDPFECFVSDDLYRIIEKDLNVRLMENEMNNLIVLNEILFNL